MLIMGETLVAGDGCGWGVGWLAAATRLCDDEDADDGGVAVEGVDSACDVSTKLSVKWDVAAVEDVGDDVAGNFRWSDLLFFTGGGRSVSWCDNIID